MTAPPLHEVTTGRARGHAPAMLREDAPRGAAADRRSVVWFVALVTVLVAASVVATSAMPALVPFVLAIGPAFIALGIAWREGNGAARRLLADLVRRPTRRAWYLVIGLPIAAAFATVLIGIAFGYDKESLLGAVMPAVLIVPLVVLIPAFAEELAWRGFATSRLITSMSPLAASLVLAVPWTVVHLVLLLPGGMNEGAELWPTVLMIVAYSVVLTWVFVASGSVLLAALVHTGLNGVVPLMSGIDTEAAWIIRSVVAVVVALGVVVLAGRGTGVMALRLPPVSSGALHVPVGRAAPGRRGA